MEKIIASCISRVFDPFIVFTILTSLAAQRSGLAGSSFIRFLFIYFAGIIGPPLALLVWALKTKRISDWDISKREERVRALAVFLVIFLFNFFLISQFGTPYLFQLFLVFFLWFFGFFLITGFWKISGHMGTITIAVLFVIHWFGRPLVPLIFLLPCVGWSRIILKKHTISQVIGGFLYAVSIYYGSQYLNFIR